MQNHINSIEIKNGLKSIAYSLSLQKKRITSMFALKFYMNFEKHEFKENFLEPQVLNLSPQDLPAIIKP